MGELRSISGPREWPGVVNIGLTKRCDAGCIMCPAKSSGADMQWDIARDLIDQCLCGPIDRLQWTGNVGEPTLVPELLIKCIRYTKETAPNVMQGLFTSGIGLTPLLSQVLIDIGIADIAFSVDSLKPDVYRRIRPGLDFGTVMSNIHTFLAINEGKVKTRLHVVAMGANYRDLPTMRQYWEDKVDGFSWLPADGRGSKYPAFVDEGDNYPCYSPFTGLCVAGDGTVAWCCQDLTGEHGLGRFPEVSIMEAWNCVALKHVRGLHLTGRKRELPLCKHCRTYY